MRVSFRRAPAPAFAGLAGGGWIRRWGTVVRRGVMLFMLGGVSAPLWALNPERPPDRYSIFEWSVDRGLPSDKVRAFTQTQDGYLWIATAHGISRFDGNRFTNFTGATNPELGGGGFFAIIEAPDGTLWAGGDDGLFRYHQGHFEHFTTAHGLAHNYVRALALARDGAVVACTRTGYSFVRNGKITTPSDWKVAHGVTRSYLEAADGTHWLGTDDGLWHVRGNEIVQVSETGGLPAHGYVALMQTSDGSVWIGHVAGVRRIWPDGRNEDIGPAQGLNGVRVTALCLDHDGNMWITSSTGVYRYRDGRAQLANYPDSSLRGAALHDLLEDRAGALWIAGAPGLYRLQDTAATAIGQAAGLKATGMYAVLESKDGGWWFGSWNGGVYRYQRGRAAPWMPAGQMLDRVLSLAEATDGAMWVGTDHGVIRGTATKAENFYQPEHAAEWQAQLRAKPDSILPGLAHTRVNCLASDGAAGMWIGTDGALYHTVDGGFRAYTTADGLPGNVIKGALRAPNGDVWITAPPAGVARYRDGKWTAWLCGKEISPVFPRAVYADSRGAIWVTTEGGGVNRFDGQQWRQFSTAEGLADGFISGLAEDEEGNLWMGFPRGVMRVLRTELDELEAGRLAKLRPRILDRSDGLPPGEPNQQGSPSTWRARDGRLLFATDAGVAVIEPRQVTDRVLQPPVYIERMIISGVDVAMGKSIEIPPGNNDVEFRYTAVETLAPEKLRFRMRLSPLDQDWVDAGAQRDVRYAKLPPGQYEFSVVATNTAGDWPTKWPTVAFTVRPFFYQRTGFLVSVGTALVALVGLTFWARSRLARRQLARLGRLVDERTRALRAATDEAQAAVVAKNEFIAALKQAQEETARQRARFKFVFDVVPIGFASMIQGRPETRIINPACVDITGVPMERCTEEGAFVEATHPDDRDAMRKGDQRLASGEINSYAMEKRYVHPDGTVRWAIVTAHLYRDTAGQVQEIRTIVDITARREAEAKLAETNRQLLETSRQAGMAEVATGVLHNVGNVLNSVNVSASMLSNLVRHSKIDRVAKVSDLLQENAANLSGFIAEDPRGQRLPAFLRALADHLTREQGDLLAELESLQRNIEHIKEVVAMQQSYARVSGVVERLPIVELIENALRINAATLERHHVRIIRDYRTEPTLVTDKHRVIQIFVNLIQNAKHACKEAGRSDPEIAIRVEETEGKITVGVTDNGVGIPRENLTRIFSHGFTTRKNGHGFGLHSGAIAARELGGSLIAASDGPGRGATFTLELPEHPPAKGA